MGGFRGQDQACIHPGGLGKVGEREGKPYVAQATAIASRHPHSQAVGAVAHGQNLGAEAGELVHAVVVCKALQRLQRTGRSGVAEKTWACQGSVFQAVQQRSQQDARKCLSLFVK